MPLTKKGKKILASMEETYPSEEKAKEVFYASRNAGRIKGVERGDHGPGEGREPSKGHGRHGDHHS